MTPTLTPEVVAEARRLVAMGHSVDHLAHDGTGFCVHPTDSRATCFCVMGAIIRASDDQIDAFRAVENLGFHPGDVIRRSDRSQESALAVLDELAARISPAEGAQP